MSIEKCLELCEQNNVKLLYLCKFGSHLYGLNAPNSDVDYKGIFLPNKVSLLLGQRIRSLHYSSGNDNGKNSNEDVDIDLFSLHYFLELAQKGETNALDILFSPSNQEAVVYNNTRLNNIFNNPLKILNPSKVNAYIGYAIGQAKKYQISGSRLGVIKDVYKYVEALDKNDFEDMKLSDIIDNIINQYQHDSYCFTKIVNDEPALVLCGKVHLLSIKMSEFYNRISREYNKYGDRVKKAQAEGNIDYKALSHACRSIRQMEQLLTTGTINFPFTGPVRQELIDIKQGKMPYSEIEKRIIEGLDRIEKIKESDNIVKGETNKGFIKQQILKFYMQED